MSIAASLRPMTQRRRRRALGCRCGCAVTHDVPPTPFASVLFTPSGGEDGPWEVLAMRKAVCPEETGRARIQSSDRSFFPVPCPLGLHRNRLTNQRSLVAHS